MNVLVVGGSQFIGRHVTSALLNDNHNITLLNRGKTDPNPKFPLIRADRSEDDLHKIPELQQNWDAIIDLSAYFPKDVASLLNAVAGRYQRYVLCSTVSVFEGFKGPIEGRVQFNEDSPLLECTYEECANTSMETYGQRKAECERVAWDLAGRERTVVLRPSVVYGEFDYTDRFAYWIWRASRGNPYMLPEGGTTTTSLTYAPDLGKAFVAAIQTPAALGNSYNIAEATPLTFRERVKLIGDHLTLDSLKSAVPMEVARLATLGIKPWIDLPLWLPKTDLLVDSSKSHRELNLIDTPPNEAIAAATDAFLRVERAPRAGISQAAEQELLKRS